MGQTPRYNHRKSPAARVGRRSRLAAVPLRMGLEPADRGGGRHGTGYLSGKGKSVKLVRLAYQCICLSLAQTCWETRISVLVVRGGVLLVVMMMVVIMVMRERMKMVVRWEPEEGPELGLWQDPMADLGLGLGPVSGSVGPEAGPGGLRRLLQLAVPWNQPHSGRHGPRTDRFPSGRPSLPWPGTVRLVDVTRPQLSWVTSNGPSTSLTQHRGREPLSSSTQVSRRLSGEGVPSLVDPGEARLWDSWTQESSWEKEVVRVTDLQEPRSSPGCWRGPGAQGALRDRSGPRLHEAALLCSPLPLLPVPWPLCLAPEPPLGLQPGEGPFHLPGNPACRWTRGLRPTRFPRSPLEPAPGTGPSLLVAAAPGPRPSAPPHSPQKVQGPPVLPPVCLWGGVGGAWCGLWGQG
ncbi:uncharacterized protein LOC125613085 [Marmota marmota marmota]|uniref:uncharacterized protein LOC125613085 n=1 Tax=Marmota marmota marmota TaxID=9994 RepID=UPI0020932AF9|nr:uncharacterized protein LOC125613085 [Marmota marmota marmota]